MGTTWTPGSGAAASASGRGVDGALILALDQGTTNTKALLVEASTGRVIASAARRVGIAFPAPGWVEQDAADIWAATEAAVDDVLRAADEPALAAVAISNQRESVAVWDTDGVSRGPVLGWQDARTAGACAELAEREPALAAQIRSRTGLDLDPMFSAPKMRWLLDAVGSPGEMRAGSIRVGTIDTYLLAQLTGEHATEAGNASRTLLLDLATQTWDEELCEAFGVPLAVLAPVRRSDALLGRTLAGGRIPAGVPVLSVLADSHAALYHHAGGRPGEGKATYGTGSSVMVGAASAEVAPSGVAATLAWLTDAPAFAREGNVVASGAALTWMAQILTDGDLLALGALAAQAEPGLAFVPAFSGLGAPYFDRGATGLLAGITGGTTRADLARAAFEAVAHQVCDVVEAMEADGAAHLDVLHADGGATASVLLMQTQADLLGRPVRVSGEPEASALGAAMLGARSLGHDWATGAGRAGAAAHRVVEPALDASARTARREAWRSAVARSRGLAATTRTTTSRTTTPRTTASTSNVEATQESRRTL
ncbi:Glycerol kinase [Serinibacter arcticus]|uniref:ATP:glycerol 3-phosphotransferase n=1 Tax=Serinibacter arcticus TaxID=1655435 RepID=A0A4Z1EAS7_9MICO|nr:Glycerol kinase [Serinibacter arcticus]